MFVPNPIQNPRVSFPKEAPPLPTYVSRHIPVKQQSGADPGQLLQAVFCEMAAFKYKL